MCSLQETGEVYCEQSLIPLSSKIIFIATSIFTSHRLSWFYVHKQYYVLLYHPPPLPTCHNPDIWTNRRTVTYTNVHIVWVHASLWDFGDISKLVSQFVKQWTMMHQMCDSTGHWYEHKKLSMELLLSAHHNSSNIEACLYDLRHLYRHLAKFSNKVPQHIILQAMRFHFSSQNFES